MRRLDVTGVGLGEFLHRPLVVFHPPLVPEASPRVLSSVFRSLGGMAEALLGSRFWGTDRCQSQVFSIDFSSAGVHSHRLYPHSRVVFSPVLSSVITIRLHPGQK